jgi:hypothetical protein
MSCRRGDWLKTVENRLETKLSVGEDRTAAQQIFEVASQRSIYRSLEKMIVAVKSRRDLFLHLTDKLDKFFAIHKASFSIHDPSKDFMRVPIVLQRGVMKSGVVISIAGEKSLMRNVLSDGSIYVEDFPKQAVGNIVERKLLLLDETSSLAIAPLCCNGVQLGTINFASPAPFAFSVFSSHLFDYLFSKVAQRFANLK